jgi:hypothetical protein
MNINRSNTPSADHDFPPCWLSDAVEPIANRNKTSGCAADHSQKISAT